MSQRSAIFTRSVRAVLAWFVLTLVAAFASPIVHKAAMQAVCDSTGGIRYVVTADHGDHAGYGQKGGQAGGHGHEMECSLCFVAKAPPPVEFDVQKFLLNPIAHALLPLVSVEIEARAGASLPPRGPPSFQA